MTCQTVKNLQEKSRKGHETDPELKLVSPLSPEMIVAFAESNETQEIQMRLNDTINLVRKKQTNPKTDGAVYLCVEGISNWIKHNQR